jgi:hypothetical protein
MTGDRDLWNAVFAAAYVEQVRRTMDLGQCSLDWALETGTPEEPCTIADYAVQELKRWKKENKP